MNPGVPMVGGTGDGQQIYKLTACHKATHCELIDRLFMLLYYVDTGGAIYIEPQWKQTQDLFFFVLSF